MSVILNNEGVIFQDGSIQRTAGGFAAGTRMFFRFPSAPSGWTTVTAYDNYAIRVVSGTAGFGSGGSVPFSTAFAYPGVSGSVGAVGLNADQIPNHYHNTSESGHQHGLNHGNGNPGGAQPGGGKLTNSSDTFFPATPSISVGGVAGGAGAAHSHDMSGASASINVAYIDFILAEKD